MGFVDDLKEGRPGLKLGTPAAWAVSEDQPRRAVFVDNDRRVGWHVSHAPFYLDLDKGNDDELRKDVERHCRHAFAEQYAALQLPPELAAKRPPVRTADPSFPGWTPLIAMEHVKLGDVEALQVIRRLVYEPVMEVVIGSLLIPVASGIVELTAFCRTNETGAREGMLFNLAVQQQPGKRPEELLRLLGQAFFDDPAQDEKFGNHPLTLVRKALAWMQSRTDDDRPTLTAALPELPRGEVELSAASSIITPPARYLPVPRGNIQVPPTMSVLARVGLEPGDNARVLDVWQIPDVLITAKGQEQKEHLLGLVKQSGQEFEAQGATNIQLSVKDIDAPENQARAGADLEMSLGGKRAQLVTRWIVDDDGFVFRIGIGAPTYVPIQEIAKEADAVLASWRRIKPLRTAWLTSDQRLRKAAS